MPPCPRLGFSLFAGMKDESLRCHIGITKIKRVRDRRYGLSIVSQRTKNILERVCYYGSSRNHRMDRSKDGKIRNNNL
jgi:hypothetical protein